MNQERKYIDFYFRVNNSKLHKPYILERQINMITNRLILKHKIQTDNYGCVEFGRVGDDFVYNKVTMRIRFII